MTTTNFNYYKDYPIVRKGDELYYGYMGEESVAMIQISHKSENDSIDVADNIKVYLVSTKTNLPVKNAVRDNLYEALDLAYTWLELAKKK